MLTSDKYKISMKRCWSDRSGKMTTQLKPWHLTSSLSSCVTFTELCFRCYLRCNDSENAYIHFAEFTTKAWRGSIIYPTCSQSQNTQNRATCLLQVAPPGNFSSLQGTYLSPTTNKEVKVRDQDCILLSFSQTTYPLNQTLQLVLCIKSVISMLLNYQKPRQKGRTSPT